MKIATHIKGKRYDTARALAEEMKAEALTEDEITLAEIDIAICDMMTAGDGKGTNDYMDRLSELLIGKYDKGNGSVPGSVTEILPSENKLYQNYPNPFNPVTQIKFDLAKTADVKLSIYNIAGQKVIELANGVINAGKHSVEFDGSKFNSGVYFYTLETDGSTIAKKMVLTK